MYVNSRDNLPGVISLTHFRFQKCEEQKIVLVSGFHKYSLSAYIPINLSTLAAKDDAA
jgi:hypothetical protein